MSEDWKWSCGPVYLTKDKPETFPFEQRQNMLCRHLGRGQNPFVSYVSTLRRFLTFTIIGWLGSSFSALDLIFFIDFTWLVLVIHVTLVFPHPCPGWPSLAQKAGITSTREPSVLIKSAHTSAWQRFYTLTNVTVSPRWWPCTKDRFSGTDRIISIRQDSFLT